MMHEIVGADRNSCVYEMKSFLNTTEKTARFKIKNDRDVQYAFGRANGIPEVYVIV